MTMVCLLQLGLWRFFILSSLHRNYCTLSGENASSSQLINIMSRVPNVWAAIIIPVPASALALFLRIKARRMTPRGVGYDDGLSIAAWVVDPTIHIHSVSFTDKFGV
jgi:hypothetical protein